MKKLLIALLAVVFLFPIFIKPVAAQESGGLKSIQKNGSITKIKEIDEFNAALEANILTKQGNNANLSKDFNDHLFSLIVQRPLGGIPEDDGNGGVVRSQGMVGNMNRVIAMMMNTPAATTERYVADVLNSAGFKIAQPAYAQGLGFAALDPILETWKVFRNMAYLFFVVIFLVIGFLIMMRQKIGGQTVVTAQQAIPQIIISLLLVTFSYAIAGLMIDLMYVVMYLMLALFQQDSATFLNKNFLTLGWTMITSGASSAYDAVEGFSLTMQNAMGEFGQKAVEFLGGITLAAVVAIAITIKVFELFFELLKSYTTIVLSITFSPVLLAFGAIPGQNPFKQWMLDLIGNLAAFPTVLLVLIVFDKLTGNISGVTVPIEGGGFNPPYLIGGAGPSIMPFILGMGMLTIMPEIVKQVKKSLGAKEGIFQQFAGNIGDSLKKGVKDGGNVVPGLGFTKVPGFADAAKWTGEKAKKYAVDPVAGQIKHRYTSSGLREIIPRGVQEMQPEVPIDPSLARGRTTTSTELGGMTPSERGAAPVRGTDERSGLEERRSV